MSDCNSELTNELNYFSLVSMRLLMTLHVAFLSELFVTDLAREGLFPCVKEFMTVQNAFGFKSFATSATSMQVLWMHMIIVVPKTMGGIEDLVTLVTFELINFLWLRMHLVIVACKSFCCTKRFVALVTLELVDFWWLVFLKVLFYFTDFFDCGTCLFMNL